MSPVGGEDPPEAGSTPALDEAVELVRAVVAANVAGAVELVERIDEVVRRVAAEGQVPAAGPGDLLTRLVRAALSAPSDVGAHGPALLDALLSVVERALRAGAAGVSADTEADGGQSVRSALCAHGPGGGADRVVPDILAFVSDHREEAGLVAGWLRGLAAAIAAAAAGDDDEGPPAPQAPRRRRSHAAEELRRSPSLLR